MTTNPLPPAPMSQVLAKRIERLTDDRDAELMGAFAAHKERNGTPEEWEPIKEEIRARWRGDVFEACANVLATAEGTMATIMQIGSQLGLVLPKLEQRKLGTGKEFEG